MIPHAGVHLYAWLPNHTTNEQKPCENQSILNGIKAKRRKWEIIKAKFLVL